MVSALDLQAEYRGFESRSGRDNFQTISIPSSDDMPWIEYKVTDSMGDP